MQSTVWVCLPIASGLIFDLSLVNKVGSQVGKGKHQRTDDSLSIIVIDACFSLIKSLYSLKIQMWFYHHKIVNFMYPFVLKKVVRRTVDEKHADTSFSWASETQTFKSI